MDKVELVNKFKTFTFGGESGIGRWLSEDIHHLVLERLQRIDKEPLTKVQFNQLLVVSKAASFSDGYGFFQHYWCAAPEHPYDVKQVSRFEPTTLATRLPITCSG